MYITNQKASRINILASSKFTNITTQVSDEGVVANELGRKLVPAGTILPANDDTAKGVLFSEVDVTQGPQPGALTVRGYIFKARLTEAPTPEAEEALIAQGITFKE